MLRSTRGLLLLAIILIVGAVTFSYYNQKRSQARQDPKPPQALPLNTDAAAQSWTWRKDEATRSTVVSAKHFRRLNQPDAVEIEDVEVRILKHDTRSYDDIRSSTAQFDETKGLMYSDGEVQIMLDLPIDGPPHGRMLQIRSSGVTYESNTGKVHTDRAAAFTFDQGDGKCVGASYDPATREILMNSQVELLWRGRNPKSKPMKIEAGALTYREKDSFVLLTPWSRLTRDTSVLEGGDAVITLKDGAIDRVDAKQPRGTDVQPERKLEYSADHLFMTLNPDGEIERILAEPNARVVATSATGRTTMTGDKLDMTFDTASGASELKEALATGKSTIESVPAARKDAPTPETRILHSEVVLAKMRPGGRDVDTVETHAPGKLEFLPNQAGQRRRTLDAERMTIRYAPGNIISTFNAYKAATRTEPEPVPPPKAGQKPAKPGDPVLTWSNDMKAEFDPKTGQLTRMEQWTDFRYEEGQRRARANRAELEEARNRITLDQRARVWDDSGATSADRILLDQKTGDVVAEGNVVSTRMPDRKGKSSAMLSNDQPLEGKGDRMTTAQRNQKIRYEGKATVWQGASRIWGDVIDIDRTQRVLTAHGHVRTQFLDQQKNAPAAAQTDGKPAPPARAPAVVTVQSADLVYTDADRVAHYTGGVHLVRPGLDLKAAKVDAWLNEQNADSSLNHAFAEKDVCIVRTEPVRILTGTGEHAEYYAADERILLTGGDATLVDSVRGLTKGKQLTYFAKLDKLLVNGVEKQPVTTYLRRR